MGANLFEFVGPNKTIIGMLAKLIMCIIPLSIDIALSSLVDKAVTKGGPDKDDTLSGNIALLIFFLILRIISVSFFQQKILVFYFFEKLFLLG